MKAFRVGWSLLIPSSVCPRQLDRREAALTDFVSEASNGHGFFRCVGTVSRSGYVAANDSNTPKRV